MDARQRWLEELRRTDPEQAAWIVEQHAAAPPLSPERWARIADILTSAEVDAGQDDGRAAGEAS